MDWSVFVVFVAGVGGQGADALMCHLQKRYPQSAILGGVSAGCFSRPSWAASPTVQFGESCVVRTDHRFEHPRDAPGFM